jgi:hypothetical protein
MKSFKTFRLAVAAATLLVAGSAFAQRPASVAQTTWTVQTNRGVAQLFIDTQTGTGAPGSAQCHAINGRFSLNEPEIDINGWYCPPTGRIHFLHHNAGTGRVVRVLTGNVSDEVPGQRLFMAGTATVFVSAFGDFGEYNFAAHTLTAAR